MNLVIAALLLAHGAIHLGFVSKRPPATAGGPEWPFTLDSSWLIRPFPASRESLRWVGFALTAATVGGFGVAALAALSILPHAAWVAGVSVGAVASIALLGVFFHRWLVVGVVIDGVVLWATWIARWTPSP